MATPEQVRDIIIEHGVPLLVMRDDIAKHTRHRPVAIMLPLSVLPDGVLPITGTVFGLPITWGDRRGLVYDTD
jgi:hypothetical protein